MPHAGENVEHADCPSSPDVQKVKVSWLPQGKLDPSFGKVQLKCVYRNAFVRYFELTRLRRWRKLSLIGTLL